jgi:uncharacterized SAM-binding protein YcdF (DUF218 family)
MDIAADRQSNAAIDRLAMLLGLARWLGYLTMIAVVVATLVLVVGFGSFISKIATEEIRIDRSVDGIVVLTGAASRIPDAIELLAEKRDARLLITGVHRATSASEIARLTPIFKQMFACCIDLDRSALNTLGNAIETRRWARDRGFKKLIIVTSNWHMPRAMVEIEHQLPEAELVAYPVVSEKFRSEVWWSNMAVVRLYLSEYLKYVFAVIRIHLDPDRV